MKKEIIPPPADMARNEINSIKMFSMEQELYGQLKQLTFGFGLLNFNVVPIY